MNQSSKARGGIFLSTLHSPRKKCNLRMNSTRVLHALVVLSLLAPSLAFTVEPAYEEALDSVVEEMPEGRHPYELSRPMFDRPEPRQAERPLSNAEEDASTSPVMFIENVGQFDDEARFQVRGAQGNIYLAEQEIWITQFEIPEKFLLASIDAEGLKDQGEADNAIRGVHLRLSFPGASRQAELEGFVPHGTTVSYFKGSDPEGWHTDVPVWGGVRYTDLYPDVDLEITSDNGQLVWRLIEKNPSAGSEPDPNLLPGEMGRIGVEDLRLRVEGGSGLDIVDGKLWISNPIKELILPLPELILADGTSLPGQSFSPVINGDEITLFGKNGQSTSPEDLYNTSALTRLNSTTYSAKLYSLSRIMTNPLGQPMAVDATSPLKALLVQTDDLLYSTFLGGDLGETGYDLAIGTDGSAYITGMTGSVDFPTSPGAFQESGGVGYDAFVTRMNPLGTERIYASYLAGSADDVARGIDVDASGAAYVAGRTWSTDFPVTTGAWDTISNQDDGFVVKVNPSGTALDYGTYIGGSYGEQGFAVAVDANGSAYTLGQTWSPDFDTTTGALFETYQGGYWDAYVVKLNPSGTAPIYATYLGGPGTDCDLGDNMKECEIEVDNSGAAYIGGITNEDFPTTAGAYDELHNGGADAFISKLNPSGSAFEYSTYLGGTSDDCLYGCTIAIDSLGAVYITGATSSANFPVSTGAYDIELNGDDGFVSKISPDGSTLAYSTFLGGTLDDYSFGIDVTGSGIASVVGETYSTDFPEAGGDFGGVRDAFVAVLNADASGLLRSFYLGGDNDDVGYGIIFGGDNNRVYVGGWTESGDFPTTADAYQTVLRGGSDAFVSQVALAPSVISDESVLSGCGDGKGSIYPEECDFSNQSTTQGDGGDPINTRTGGFDYPVTDISIPTVAIELSFRRSYSSLATDLYTDVLGFGWTHNHDTRLIFSDDPGGREGVVLFKAHSANQYEIVDNGDGTYSASPGVGVTLTRNDGPPVTFTLIGQSQNSYTFDEDGTLLTWADPQGHTRTYTYGVNGRLDLITDVTSGRYLDIGYDTNDRIETVTDHTGRSITFGYDAAGDLTSVNDVMGEDWTYEYDDHRLTYVRDPRLVSVVRTVYDIEGRAEQQYYESDGIEILLVDITYLPDGTATLLDGLGSTQTHTYDERSTLLEDADNSDNGIIKDYDYNFRPTAITDRRNETTYLSWGADGANLESIIDAGENPVSLYYDDLNNLTQIVDAREFPTDFVYTGTLLDEIIDAYDENTLYTYTTAADAPQPEGLLKTVEDRNGNLTEYEYDEEGNLITVTQYDDGVPIETQYGYDELGRQMTVEDPLGMVNWTCYDSAGRVVRSVANASGDGASPQTDPCDAVNYIPGIDPDQDRISSFVYDEVGNAIASINPAGVIRRTYFDDSNRPELVVQNLTGKLIEDEVPPVCLPANTEINLCTKYDYDESGNTIATTDHLGHITRTYYDALNRPEMVVQNLTNHDPLSSTPPLCISSNNETNLCTKYDYDENSNTIAITDHLGRITRTYYDALNRPEVVVQNLISQGILIETPPYCDPGSTLEDLCTEYYYDENGNTIATVNSQGMITRTYYDALNRPEVVVQNLTGQGISIETPPVCVHTSTTENLCTEYYYDNEGNTIATVDPAGVTTRTYYDDLNRPEKVVQNLTGSIYEAPPDYNSAYPDQNVDTEYVYDDSGKTIATIDVLGRITRTYYDDLGRGRFVVRNLDPSYGISNETPPVYSASNPDENVRTETVYDDDGNAIATIDTLDRITRTYYDNLGRSVVVVRNLDPAYGIYTETPPVYNPNNPDENVLTEYVYDGLGNLIETTDPNGQVSYSCLDGLNRVVRSVQNPSVSDPCGSYTHNPDLDRDVITETLFDGLGNALTTTDANGIDIDYEYDELNRLLSENIDPEGLNLTTSYSYDGLGNRTWRTDAEGVETKFEYDVFGRLTAVVENFDDWLPTNDSNVRTDYTYDKIGNRLSIEDGKDQVTEFVYDDLNRLISESADPYGLNLTIHYGYDGLGNRTSVTDAEEHTTDYDYDGLNRLIEVNYNDLGVVNVTFTYDGLGNRLTMVDGAGTTTWNYDELNRPLFVNDPFGDDVGYTYDAGGNRLSLTYPGLGTVSYQYDALGRMEEVEDWDSLQNTVYTYDDGGRLKTASLPNGLNSTYDYDNANNLLTIEHASIDLEVLSSYEYTYDNVGNRTHVIEYLAPITTATPTPSPTPTETEIPIEVLVGEVGQVSDLTDTPQTVIFTQSYTDPVVFAQPVSFNSDDTSVVRITDVQADRFTMYVHEAPDKDGAHPQETVSYLVLEAGAWQLADGTLLEVGKVSTTSAVVYPTWDDWEEIVLSAGFGAAPAVLSQVQSENNSAWVKTRQKDVSASSFYVTREYWEAYPEEPSGSEVIGWMAMEAGEGDWSGHTYEAGNTPNVVEENWYEIVFSASFSSSPRFLASLATYLDPDPAALRYTALDQTSVDVFVEEDTTDRPEVNHDPEGVSYLALEGDGTLEAIDIGGEFLFGPMGDSATTTPTSTPTPSVSPTSSLTPIATVTPTTSPSPTPSITATAEATATLSPSPTLTPMPSASSTPSSTPTAEGTPSLTSTSTATSTPTAGPSPIAFNDAQQDGHPVSYLADSRQTSLLGSFSIRAAFEPLFSSPRAEVPVADTRDQDPSTVFSDVEGTAGMAGREGRGKVAVLEIFEALYDLLAERLGSGMLSAAVGQSFPADDDPSYEGSVLAKGKPTASNTPTTTNTYTPTYTPTNTSTPTDTPTPSPNFEVSYIYDDLYRLIQANYTDDDGTFFHYTYDAVGNRLTQDSLAGTNTYDYDSANRLILVDGVTYTWDNNGNLLSDGVSTYTYTRDNMLASVNKGGVVYEYLYSGLGDRLGQTVDGVSTHYTLDIVSGLTQVLSDGTNAYLYGKGRIGEEGAGGWQYPLGDALSSVRQLTDSEGYVGLVKAYEPFGSVLSSTGDDSTNYGFTGEWTDDYIELIYLRSRYMSVSVGRFTQKDPSGLEDNPYLYSGANPISNIDPSGLAYNRALATSFARRWNQYSAPAIFPRAYDVFGGEAAEIIEKYYTKYYIDEINLSTPLIWTATSGIDMWTDCANFASHVLYQGGIRDNNSEQPIELLRDPGFQQFWNPKLMIGEPFGYARDEWGISTAENPFEKWTRVIEFEKFLHGQGIKQNSYTGKIPQFLNGRQVNDGNNKEWMAHLNTLNIQPGDIVLYNYGSKWDHAAVIMGWGPQTSYGFAAPTQGSFAYTVLPREFWLYTCKFDVSGWKPRVVDRDGKIQYNNSRSIDNTPHEVIDMAIFHITG